MNWKKWLSLISDYIALPLLAASLLVNVALYDKSAHCNEISIQQEDAYITARLTEYIGEVTRYGYGDYSEFLAKIYVSAAKEFNVDPYLLVAIGDPESKYTLHAVSSAGAMGVQQVMPFWVKEIPFLKSSRDLLNPELNIRASAYIVAHYKELCGAEAKYILKCYHGGPKALKNPKASTLAYVQDVLNAREIIVYEL